MGLRDYQDLNCYGPHDYNCGGYVGNVALMLEEEGDDEIKKEDAKQKTATREDDQQISDVVQILVERNPLCNAQRRNRVELSNSFGALYDYQDDGDSSDETDADSDNDSEHELIYHSRPDETTRRRNLNKRQ